MRCKTLFVAASLLACGVSAHAEKLSKEFKQAFEKVYTPRRTYAVVVEKGVPTTSIYGVNGQDKDAHYSVDVVDGRWKTSEGWLDSDQKAADFLMRGELLELASISYKDNRVDLRMVSLEAHKVTRGEWLSEETLPEPVATNFKFFFSGDKSRTLTPADMPEVRKYIGAFFEVFDDHDEARLFAARMLVADAGGGSAVAASGEASEIKAGMTPLQVIEVLGKPQKEIVFESRTKWTYPDVTVVFEQCRVANVEF